MKMLHASIPATHNLSLTAETFTLNLQRIDGTLARLCGLLAGTILGPWGVADSFRPGVRGFRC